MGKHIGSQYRETLKESGYTFVRRYAKGTVILRSPDGQLELWFAKD